MARVFEKINHLSHTSQSLSVMKYSAANKEKFHACDLAESVLAGQLRPFCLKWNL